MALSVSHYSTAAPAAAPLSRWSSSRRGGKVARFFDDPLAPPRAQIQRYDNDFDHSSAEVN